MLDVSEMSLIITAVFRPKDNSDSYLCFQCFFNRVSERHKSPKKLGIKLAFSLAKGKLKLSQHWTFCLQRGKYVVENAKKGGHKTTCVHRRRHFQYFVKMFSLARAPDWNSYLSIELYSIITVLEMSEMWLTLRPKDKLLTSVFTFVTNFIQISKQISKQISFKFQNPCRVLFKFVSELTTECLD